MGMREGIKEVLGTCPAKVRDDSDEDFWLAVTYVLDVMMQSPGHHHHAIREACLRIIPGND